MHVPFSIRLAMFICIGQSINLLQSDCQFACCKLWELRNL